MRKHIHLNKKGQSETLETLAKWIIILVTLLLLIIVFGYMFYETSLRESEESICKLSVRASAIKMLKGMDFVVSAIKCPPTEVEIDFLDEQEIYDELAFATYECWDKFGEGKLIFYDVGRGAEEMFCTICSYVNFTGGAADRRLYGYAEHLMTKKVPKYGDDRSMYGYISGEEPSDLDLQWAREVKELGDVPKNFNNSIDTSKGYMVLFVSGLEESYWRKMDTAALGAVVGASAIAIGSVALAIATGGAAWPGVVFALKALAATVIGGGYGAVQGYQFGPEAVEDWIPGVMLVPFEEAGFIEQRCTRFGQ